jgi:hypothetical protein
MSFSYPAMTGAVWAGPQFPRPGRAVLRDLDEVLRQVEELLPVGEEVRQPVGHERLCPGGAPDDLGLRDGDLLAVGGGVDQGERVRLLGRDQPRDRPVVGPW